MAEVVDAVVLGTILFKVQVQVLCFAKKSKLQSMPQLDALTYFSQYVYLLITFSAVYYYVLNFIIPKIVGTFKIRQKLNSLNRNQTEDSKNSAQQQSAETTSIELLKLFSQHYGTERPGLSAESGNMALQYDHLLNQAWLANTTQANAVESANQWLVSTVALQLAHNLRLKKLLCDHIVRKITIN